MGVARGARFLPGGWGSLLVAVVVILVLSSLPSPAAALVRGRHQISEMPMSSSFTVDGGAAQGSSSPSSLRRALLGERNTHARPDYDYYLSKTATMAEVARIVSMHPGFMRVDTMESTRDGYSSSLTVVTVEPGGFGTGGEDGEEKKKKTRVLYNYGEHGRELITVDVAVQLLRDLARGVEHVARLADPAAVMRCRCESSDPLGTSDAAGRYAKGTVDETAAALLNTVFKIVPMENVNGRTKVEGGDFCERKNGRGVDCNRNWAVDWGVKAPDYDPYEEYPGTAPFSEPEAFMLKTLMEDFNPHVWVNVHSGMEALFMPFDHKAAEPSGPGPDAMKRILTDINRMHCGGRCVVGSGGLGVGYLAHGTATDYVFVQQRAPIAFTWEIYGDQQSHYMDCFRMFNPVHKSGHDKVVKDWVGAAISLLPMLKHHPDLPMAAALRASTAAKAEAAVGGSLGVVAAVSRAETPRTVLRGGGEEAAASVLPSAVLRTPQQLAASSNVPTVDSAAGLQVFSGFGQNGAGVNSAGNPTMLAAEVFGCVLVAFFAYCCVLPRYQRMRFIQKVKQGAKAKATTKKLSV